MTQFLMATWGVFALLYKTFSSLLHVKLQYLLQYQSFCIQKVAQKVHHTDLIIIRCTSIHYGLSSKLKVMPRHPC